MEFAVVAFVGNQARVAGAVFNRYGALERFFNKLALKIEQGLRRGKNRPRPPWSGRLTRLFQICRQQRKRAGVTVEFLRAEAMQVIGVARQRVLAQVECGKQARVDQPVSNSSDAVLFGDLNRGAPKDDFALAEIRP